MTGYPPNHENPHFSSGSHCKASSELGDPHKNTDTSTWDVGGFSRIFGDRDPEKKGSGHTKKPKNNLKGVLRGVNPSKIWEPNESLVGGLEHQFYFPIYIRNLIIPIDFHIFQRGGPGPPTRRYGNLMNHVWLMRLVLFLLSWGWFFTP